MFFLFVFFSSRRRHTRCALVTGVQTCALPIFQADPVLVPTERKIAFINRLIEAGVRRIEATSFVSPRAVPQLADAAEVMKGVKQIGRASCRESVCQYV